MYKIRFNCVSNMWKVLLRAVILSSGLVAGLVVTTIAHADTEVLPVDIVLNTVKCEVAQFQAKNSDYSRQPDARYVIQDAEIRLSLRYSQGASVSGGGGISIGIPVLKAGSIIKGKIAETRDQVAIEHQVFVFDMDTSAQDTSICETAGELLSAEAGYSILQALENAKKALEAAAAGEPRIRIRSHQIKRRMALSRETEGDSGVKLFFLSVSGELGSSTSYSQELEVTFTLSEKTTQSVAIADQDLKDLSAKLDQSDDVRSASFYEILRQISEGGSSPGNTWFLCNPMVAEDCESREWTAMSPCDLIPSLLTCPEDGDLLERGYFAESQPIIVGPKGRIEKELFEAFGWTLSQESIEGGAYGSLRERVQGAFGLQTQ